jgi:hypothetical protein
MTPDEWLVAIKSAGVPRKRIYYRSMHRLAFVDGGANDGAEIICQKARGRRAEEERPMHENNMRDVAWAEICKLGVAQRESDPSLTPQAARLKAMRTLKGQEWRAVYDDCDALLPPKAFIAKKQERAALAEQGASSWEGLASKLARDFIAARPDPPRSPMDNLQYGRRMVQTHAPHVWALAQAGRS